MGSIESDLSILIIFYIDINNESELPCNPRCILSALFRRETGNSMGVTSIQDRFAVSPLACKGRKLCEQNCDLQC